MSDAYNYPSLQITLGVSTLHYIAMVEVFGRKWVDSAVSDPTFV